MQLNDNVMGYIPTNILCIILCYPNFPDQYNGIMKASSIITFDTLLTFHCQYNKNPIISECDIVLRIFLINAFKDIWYIGKWYVWKNVLQFKDITI